jgi:alkylhydroperoxidase family enzyme
MGHGNMMLAVAGLKDEEIKVRTKKLALGEWEAFPPAERQAFAFASKLSKSPSEVNRADVAELVQTFGPHRAIDIIWYSSWVNYMTRVADAFQLPLERENVFASPNLPEKPEMKNPDEKKPDVKK